MPQTESSRRQVTTPGTGPDAQAAAKTTSSIKVARRTLRQALRSQPGRRAPIAPASVFPPGGRRTRWMFTYGCKVCGTYSLGRAADIDGVASVRRASCGHWVTVMAARVYSRPGTAA